MDATAKQRSVRVSETTHRMLRDLSTRRGEPMTMIVERAVDRYQREQLLSEANDAWAALQADPATVADIEGEQALWEQTLGDGLEREEW